MADNNPLCVISALPESSKSHSHHRWILTQACLLLPAGPPPSQGHGLLQRALGMLRVAPGHVLSVLSSGTRAVRNVGARPL